MTLLNFRPAQIQDAEAIKSFQMAMAWETEKLKLNEETLGQGVDAVFKSPELGQYHVCLQNNEVIGSLLIIKEWSDWRNGHVLWIHSLYFKPQFRGQGLFSKMYRYIQDLVKADPNARGLRLYVDKSNTKAQAVYSKLGMSDEHYSLFEWMKT